MYIIVEKDWEYNDEGYDLHDGVTVEPTVYQNLDFVKEKVKELTLNKMSGNYFRLEDYLDEWELEEVEEDMLFISNDYDGLLGKYKCVQELFYKIIKLENNENIKRN